jgi:hypothetical protein
MDLFETIQTRRSIRKYTSDPIPDRKADQQRQMELFMQLYNQILSEEFVWNYRIVMAYEADGYDGWENLPPDIADKRTHVHGLLAYLCVVVNKGYIDIEFVDDIITIRIIEFWEKFRPNILEWRIRHQDPTGGDDLEQAYLKLKQRRDQYVALVRQRQNT